MCSPTRLSKRASHSTKYSIPKPLGQTETQCEHLTGIYGRGHEQRRLYTPTYDQFIIAIKGEREREKTLKHTLCLAFVFWLRDFQHPIGINGTEHTIYIEVNTHQATTCDQFILTITWKTEFHYLDDLQDRQSINFNPVVFSNDSAEIVYFVQ